MKLVLIESPFAGDTAANLAYVREAMADSLRRGEAPYASHALYTQDGVLNDVQPDVSGEVGVIMTGASPEEVWPLIKRYHYSRRMPSNIQHCYAVREAGGLLGDTGLLQAAIVFSIPPTRWSYEVLELSRLVRTDECTIKLSSLVAFACDNLRKRGHHLLVSFADWTQKHHGGIYQASGWYYSGCRERRLDGLVIDGVFCPGRTCNHKFGTQSPGRVKAFIPDRQVEPHYDQGKHLYWRALSVIGKTRAKRLGLNKSAFPKPNAIRPLDADIPMSVSEVQPLGIAPKIRRAQQSQHAPKQEVLL